MMIKISSLSLRLISCASHAKTKISPIQLICNSRKFDKVYTIADHSQFDKEVINSDKPVIVNFHANWCDPCKLLTPKLKEMLANHEQVDLAIIDVEANPELVDTFEVKAVPAVLAFSKGVVVHKSIGLVDAKSIETLISKLSKTGGK